MKKHLVFEALAITSMLFSCSSQKEDIKLNTHDLVLAPGSTYKFEVENVSGSLLWGSSYYGVVKIDVENRSITALKEGRTLVSVLQKPSKHDHCNVAVRYDYIRPTNPLNVATIAHKGYHVDAIENTLEAFSEAGKRNFFGIETDIYLTKDNYWVCNHDSKVKGMSKTIAYSKLDEILSVNLSDDPSKEVHVCRFEDYINICAAYNKHPVIELKESVNITYLERLVEYLNEQRVINECIFISKLGDVLGTLHNLKVEKYKDFNFTYDLQMLTEGNNWQYVPEFINVSSQYDGISPAMIEDCEAVGQYVAAWTVNDRDVASSLIEKGVKYITTDTFECTDQFVDSTLFGL